MECCQDATIGLSFLNNDVGSINLTRKDPSLHRSAFGDGINQALHRTPIRGPFSTVHVYSRVAGADRCA